MSPPAVPPPSASELTALDPRAVERFRRDLNRLVNMILPDTGRWQRAALTEGDCTKAQPARPAPSTPACGGGPPPRAGEHIALAVSGGADSMAMLLLATAAFPDRVHVVTVDHGLRPEAANEAALVAEACAKLDVPHLTLKPLAPIAGSSIQSQAREARYAAIEAWMAARGIDVLLTAHHADDQAETVLMRLNRASGTSGLSGIRAVRRQGERVVLRPLLGWRQRELRALVRAAGIDWVEDPSNADSRHDRTRYRAFLAEQTLLSVDALAASAAHVAEAEAALAHWTEQLWRERWDAAAARLDPTGLPSEARRRLVRRAILAIRESNGISAPHFSAASGIEPLLTSLEAGSVATQAGILVTPRDGRWHFTLAPARRSH